MADKVEDPVCGMEICPEDAGATDGHEGRTFYFCSPAGHATYVQDPHRYSHLVEGHGRHAGHADHTGR